MHTPISSVSISQASNGLSTSQGSKLKEAIANISKSFSTKCKIPAENSILIIGRNDLQHRLVADLIKYVEPLCDAKEADVLNTIPCRLTNKYYAAGVNLVVWPHPGYSKEASKSNFEKFKVFLLLYSASEPNSFEEVKSWIQFLKDFEYADKMCVAYDVTSDMSQGKDEDQFDKEFAYCTDNWIELVNMSETPEDYIDPLFPSETSLRWTVGTERIAEALSTVQWEEVEYHKASNTT